MNKGRRIIELLLILLAVGFIAYQAITSYTSALTTESAVFYEYSEGIELSGTVIRNEHTVAQSDSGTLHFIIKDGERVAKGGTIAKVYSDDKASAAATRIAEIDAQLNDIKDLEGYNNIAAVDINTLNNKIASNLDNYLFVVSDGSFEGAAEARAELLTALSRKQVATGGNVDFTEVKKQLTEEKQRLTSVMGNHKSECKAEYSGYFVSSADGYETVLVADDLKKYTPEYLQNIEPADAGTGVIGKIVYDYEWYIAVTVPLGDSMSYKEGDSMKLYLETADSTVTATVKTVNFSRESNSAVVIFVCSEMSGDLASFRSGKITVIKNEYSGLRVSSKSVRFADGKTGVYVVSGLEIKFVAVDIVYANDEYTICKINTTDDEKLRLYDEVVVKGRGLYDGKIIY